MVVGVVLAKSKAILVALGATFLGRLLHKYRELQDKLEVNQKQVDQLANDVACLSMENMSIQQEKEKAEEKFLSEVEHMKSDFEEEWIAREGEWKAKLESKEEDAQERLEEIASWQEELGRLRSEAIAIRTAIERVRSRSTSPGRGSETTDSVGDFGSGEENRSTPEATGIQQLKKMPANDQANDENDPAQNPRGRSPLRDNQWPIRV